MGLLSWIAMGLIVGLLAKFIMPGKDPGGIVVTILLRIAGARCWNRDRTHRRPLGAPR
jgi:uncharacterized membrane protein YeaQ/YmgE (transglycosylase-associated protein family)